MMSRALTLLPVLFPLLLYVLQQERRWRRIPDHVSFTLLVLAALEAGLYRRLTPGAVLLAATMGLAIPLVARHATGGGLGWGDVKLIFALCVLLGPVPGSVAILLAALAVLAGVLVSLLLDGECRSCASGIPFGPYLVAGAILAVIQGPVHAW